MNDKRPVNLNVMGWFPITALVSILHRLSGIGLYAGMAVLLWGLDVSLESEASFAELQTTLSNPLIKIVLLLTVAALIYHLVAGIRHLIMDFGVGEELKSGRLGAKLTLALATVAVVAAGVWLW